MRDTLFTRAHPTPEQVSTLLARLGALMGDDEGSPRKSRGKSGRTTNLESDEPLAIPGGCLDRVQLSRDRSNQISQGADALVMERISEDL